jgi:multidrug resistance protein MdtO
MPLGAAMPSRTRSWMQYWREDLQATPGRLSSSLRITLTSVFVLITMMWLQMPYVAYGLYAIFMISRDSPPVTLRSAIATSLSVFCALSIALIVVILSDNDPMARVLSVSVIAFVAGMIFVATSVPALGPGWGLIYSVLIAFWENHLPADTLVKNSLWLLAAFSSGFAASVLVEYVFASRSPVDRLTDQLQTRYRALAGLFSAYADNAPRDQRFAAALRVSRLAAAGQTGMLALYSELVDRDLERGTLPIGVRVHITMLSELMDHSASFGLQTDATDIDLQMRCEIIAQQCEHLSAELRTNPELRLKVRNSEERANLDRVEIILRLIQEMPSDSSERYANLVALPSREVPFLIPGALWEIENVAFALKISLCATICYILYHAIDWPGISTSVVTVMAVGLSNTGAMKQKSVFRALGVVTGGLVLGIGAEVFLFPYMDSITSLVILIAAIAFICAWIAGGSRFNYVGMQMAFGFYITSVAGLSAPTELAPSRDRLVGVLLALLVMWFVFDQFWPVRTITVMRRAVVSVLKDGSRVVALIDAEVSFADYMNETERLRDRLGKQLSAVRTLDEAVEYEFGVDRAQLIRKSENLMQISITTVALVWNQASLLHKESNNEFLTRPELVNLRRQVAQGLSAMADALARNSSFDPSEFPSPLELTPIAGTLDLEYSRNTVARYNEVQGLAWSLGSTG